MSYPYYRFFPGDYLRDTRGLSFAQHGAYRLLLDWFYSGNPVTGSELEVAAMMGAKSPGERKAVEFILHRFWIKTDALWTQKRASIERARQELSTKQATDAVNKRWKLKHTDALRTQYEPEVEPEPELDNPRVYRTPNTAREAASTPELKKKSGTPKPNGHGERWQDTNDGIDAKGRELGITPTPGEDYPTFKQRLFAAIYPRGRSE